MNLKINKIFYSIQGEGTRVGEASIFIRLAGCNLNCSFCDTSFKRYKIYTLNNILKKIQNYPCNWIVWTGGEPTLQLTEEIILFFRKQGYKQAIETNGTNPVIKGLDYVSCSYKVKNKKIKKVDEIRILVQNKKSIPKIKDLPTADNYYLSPVFIGKKKNKIDKKALKICLSHIHNNPKWKLSIQIHKIIKIN